MDSCNSATRRSHTFKWGNYKVAHTISSYTHDIQKEVHIYFFYWSDGDIAPNLFIADATLNSCAQLQPLSEPSNPALRNPRSVPILT